MKKQGFSFLFLALLAFSGLGLEALLALLIEPLIYGQDMSTWGTTENILHWVITCMIWGAVGLLLIKIAGQKFSFDIFLFKDKLNTLNWLICLGILVFCFVISVIDWNGLKVVKEFQYNGLLKFVFQYIYYFFETVLVLLIIAFGQKAGECFFTLKNIPWGGLLAGLTWGLVHMLTKGDIYIGLLRCLFGVLYGVIYLCAKKNTFVSYILICLAFIL